MSDIPAAKVSNIQSLKPRQALIIGRVIRVKRNEGMIYTSVICPAEDQYSQPQVIELRSKDRIGNPEEDIKVVVKISGFQKRQQYVDQQTGERREWYKNNVYFDVIE